MLGRSAHIGENTQPRYRIFNHQLCGLTRIMRHGKTVQYEIPKLQPRMAIDFKCSNTRPEFIRASDSCAVGKKHRNIGRTRKSCDTSNVITVLVGHKDCVNIVDAQPPRL